MRISPRLRMVCVAALASLAPTWTNAQTLPGFPQRDAAYSRIFVSGGSIGYFMMPPILVSGPNVEEATWSPDGQYVAIRRVNSRITARQVTAMMQTSKDASPPPLRGDLGDNELLIYSRQGKLISVWKTGLTRGRVLQMGWLNDGVLVALTQTDALEGKIDVVPIVVRMTSGKASTTTLPKGKPPHYLYFSPTRAAVAIGCADGICVVRARGADSVVGLKADELGYVIRWSADGSEPYLENRGQDSEKKYYGFSESELRPLEQAPALHDGRTAAQPDIPVRLVKKKTTLALEQSQVETRALWVRVAGQKEKSYPGLVCADVTDAEISPTGDAVLYITADGAAMVRSLVPVDIALVTQAREAALRTTLLNWGKQIWFAIDLFDVDLEGLPSQAELQDKLKEYIGEEASPWLELFQYTYTGGSLSSIDNSSETVLGYLPGPGGFAVLYADGHTAWKSGAQP